MFAIIGWIFFGAIVGLIARALMPGRQSMGFVMTMILGIIGSLVGGLISWALPFGNANDPYHPAGWIMAVVGALIVLALAGMANRRTV